MAIPTYSTGFKLIAITYGTDFQLLGTAIPTYSTSFKLIAITYGTNF